MSKITMSAYRCAIMLVALLAFNGTISWNHI